MNDTTIFPEGFSPEWTVLPLFPQEITPEIEEALARAHECSYRAAMAEYGMPISAGLAFRDREGFRGIAVRSTSEDSITHPKSEDQKLIG